MTRGLWSSGMTRPWHGRDASSILARSNMEKFIYGQFSPTEKEREEAKKKGPEAVKALEEKMKKATGRLRIKQTEEALKQLEKDAEKLA